MKTYNPRNLKLIDSSSSFWKEIPVYKSDGDQVVVVDTKIEFRHTEFFKCLERNHIYRYYLNKHFIFIKIEEHIIRKLTAAEIRDFALDYLHKKSDSEEVREKIIKGASQYFSESNLANMSYKSIPQMPPQANYMDFYFQNAVVRVDADSIKILSKEQQEGFVWEENVIEHGIHLLPKSLQVEKTEQGYELHLLGKETSVFYSFLEKTSAYYHLKETLSPQEIAEQKLGSINKLSAMGYLLHNYKDPAVSKAIIAMDSKIADISESNGGTGKSLFAEALRKVLPTKYVNARDSEVFKNPHWNEGIDQQTRLLFIDDTGIKFDFGKCYNFLTGTWTIKPKNRPQYDIPHAQSPKIYIATNFAIEGGGESDLRRQFLIGFSDFFNKENTPVKYFHHRFFEDWDVLEWNRFYNLLFEATQIYLKYGLIEGKSENLEVRKLRQSVGEDFLDWAEIYFSDETNLNAEIPKKEAYENFQIHTNNKFLKVSKFKKNLILWAKMKGWNFGERLSNSVEYFSMKNP